MNNYAKMRGTTTLAKEYLNEKYNVSPQDIAVIPHTRFSKDLSEIAYIVAVAEAE